jgi:hypothetical protein
MAGIKYEIRDPVTVSVVYRNGRPTDLRYVREGTEGALYDVNQPEIRYNVGPGEIWAAVPGLKIMLNAAARAEHAKIDDNRKLPLAASVNGGRLVVSVGLDDLEAFLRGLGTEYARVTAADVAEHLTDMDKGCSPIHAAVRQAAIAAKVWDDNNEATTEPGTEFFR